MNRPPEHEAPDRTAPVVFGVLGGIASGKSAVAALLAGEHGVVLDADRFAQEALDSPEVQERLRESFGPEAVGADGRADRAFLARRVFADAGQRRRLEGWIHPLVRARILTGLAAARERGAERVVLDVPLLLENDAEHGLARLCDHLVFVEASDATRAARATARRGWARDEVARREATQMSLHEKRREAAFVIHNDGTLDDVRTEVDRLLREIDSAGHRP